MANKSFDFNKIERKIFNVNLKDGTILLILMPKKSTFEKMTGINIDEETPTIEALESLYEVCAEIMSNNKAGKKITTAYLEEDYELEDLWAFLDEYLDFANKAKDDPN